MDKIEADRLSQLYSVIPNVWSYKTILYIGAGSYRHHFFDAMKANKCIVDVVEVEEDNCIWLSQHYKWLNGVVVIDVVDFLTLDPPSIETEKYDMILWSHGVEVLTKEEGFDILKNHIERWVRPEGLIVHMTPNGEAGGNGNVCAWYEDEFKRLDYNTNSLGKRNERNSNLLAWKYIEKELKDGLD